MRAVLAVLILVSVLKTCGLLSIRWNMGRIYEEMLSNRPLPRLTDFLIEFGGVLQSFLILIGIAAFVYLFIDHRSNRPIWAGLTVWIVLVVAWPIFVGGLFVPMVDIIQGLQEGG